MLLAGAMAATALCDDGDFQWQGQLAPGQLMEIHGVIGAIHATGGPDSNGSITAHKTANVSDPAAVTIQVLPFDGGVIVCAMYPDGDPDHPNTCNPPGQDNFTSVHDNDVQVEFTVTVPAGVRFTALASQGDIQATSLTADVNVNTIRGGIAISTTGAAQATTNQGSITASIGTVNWMGVRIFDTIRGDVNLTMPSDANVSVRANTIRGGVMTDFPLTIRPTHFGATMADGTLGAGGRSLGLSTNQGNITLRQGPAASQ
jgi:hypothetical protein